MPTVATNTEVGLDELLDFARTRHQYVLATTRKDGRPQLSPVTGGVDSSARGVGGGWPGTGSCSTTRWTWNTA